MIVPEPEGDDSLYYDDLNSTLRERMPRLNINNIGESIARNFGRGRGGIMYEGKYQNKHILWKAHTFYV